MLRSLYIHVPFCRAKCAYCDFYSVPLEDRKEEIALRYVTALRREAQRRASGDLETVFIGGGTPSVLPPGSIRSIMDCLGEHAHIMEGAEVSVEANPESVGEAFVDELLASGVTRLSVGVQSFDDGLLALLGRPHTSRHALEALQWVRLSGLDLSIDLMYSIPGQTSDKWSRTLQAALDLAPSHISAYELMVEPGTVLMERIVAGELRMPSEEESLAMYHEAREALRAAGYEHYEVSNLEQGTSPPTEQETPTGQEASREFLMLGLRTTDGVDLNEASGRYSLDRLSEVAHEFQDSGLMVSEGVRLSMTEKGMPLMNTILVDLFESLGI
jgi:oxygen-independent coproporphyrinogen-3 oxidase